MNFIEFSSIVAIHFEDWFLLSFIYKNSSETKKHVKTFDEMNIFVALNSLKERTLCKFTVTVVQTKKI